MTDKTELNKLFKKNLRPNLNQLFELLGFRSVSTDPSARSDCIKCARWLCRHLNKIGWNSRLLETGSLPSVFAERRGKAGKPVVLFYGHYDVQPEDPVSAWTHDPFAPQLVHGRIIARGASDNKGQLFSFLKAAETVAGKGDLDVTVKILLDGEEESGSTGIFRNLRAWRRTLSADVLMVNDVDMAPSGDPAIIMGLRGVIFINISLIGARYDLHSGIHGGLAPNPATGIARLIASLHDETGRIAVKGFYDGVSLPTDEECALAQKSWPGVRKYVADTGVSPAGGERGKEPWLRTGFMPSLDVNGIVAGYNGEGCKTIIPSSASVKISARLVAGQDPARCLKLLEKHLRENTPPGLRLVVDIKHVAGGALRLSTDSQLVQKACKILRYATGHEPVMNWHGASIPVVSALAQASGAEPVLCGFGMIEDRVHAPDESFSLHQLRLGYLFGGLFLTSLSAGDYE